MRFSWKNFGSATIVIVAVTLGSGLLSLLASGDFSRQKMIAELEGEFVASPETNVSGFLRPAAPDELKAIVEDRLIASLVENIKRVDPDVSLLSIEHPSERTFRLRFVVHSENLTEAAALQRLQGALGSSLKSSYRLETQLGEFSLSVSPAPVSERFGATVRYLFFAVLVAGFAITALMLGAVLSVLSRPGAAFSGGSESCD